MTRFWQVMAVVWLLGAAFAFYAGFTSTPHRRSMIILGCADVAIGCASLVLGMKRTPPAS